MHELFAEVLSKKDLSKAGELFSLEDDTIEKDLEEIVEHILKIADSEEYETSDNNQSVVEICITRITTAIRECEGIEKHAPPLVSLLSMCLKHSLAQRTKDEDAPHAKIASDVMSRLFTYYTNKRVMTLVIPVVVKFLSCDNKDLVRSVASYLSLATIDNSSLLAQHMPLVFSSVLRGNYLLGQVLPQIYEQNPQPVLDRVDELAKLLSKCDSAEKVSFLQLFNKVAKTHPKLLEKHVPHLCTYLSSSLLSPTILMIFVDMATARSSVLVDHLPLIQAVIDSQPTLMQQVAQVMGALGTINKDQANKSMTYLVAKLNSVDQSVLPSVLQEIRTLGQANHGLLEENLEQVSKLSNSGSSAVRHLVQQIREDVRKHSVTTSLRRQTAGLEVHSTKAAPTHSEVNTAGRPREVKSVSSQTEGSVTVITVGNPLSSSAPPAGSVSVKSTTLPSSVGASSQQSLARIHRRTSLGNYSHSSGHGQTSEVSSYANVGTSMDNVTSQAEVMRDGLQLFCEKHFTKIKNFILKFNATIPLPSKCTVINGKHKRFLKLHFECSSQLDQCLYSGSHFLLNTRLPKLWVHLMFLSIQAQSRCALSQQDPNISCLKVSWDALKGDTSNTFLTLVTSSFPTQKDQLSLLHELHQMRYFDVFELNAAKEHWACFVCNHPEKMSELLNDGCPEIAGQLKEKKGKWKFLKRWKTRYFTLSGGSITYNKSNSTKATLPVTKIQTVKAVRKGIRDTPKAFEIFTGDQTYRFKAKGHQNVEQWVQCLHIAVARSHITAGTLPPGIHRAVSTAGAPGPALAGGIRRSSGRSSDRAITYSGLFDSQLSTSTAVNPTTNPMVNPNMGASPQILQTVVTNPPQSSSSYASRRVVMDTKL